MSLTDTPEKTLELVAAMTAWHYLRYPEQCAMRNDDCTYLDADGRRCAVGRMVPVEVAKSLVDNRVSDAEEACNPKYAYLPNYMYKYNTLALSLIQGVHDHAGITYKLAGGGIVHRGLPGAVSRLLLNTIHDEKAKEVIRAQLAKFETRIHAMVYGADN